MNFRLVFLPLSFIYGAIVRGRNFLYDKRLLKSVSFDLPIINVGNLRVGGTGKTPQIEYLIRLLKNDYKVAVISRGYKRQSKGFIVADQTASPEKIGDEPYQIFRKFKDIIVAVDTDRVRGIRQVLAQFSPDVILLDDAWQHRKIQAGLHLLLSPYDQPFYQDYVFPAGNLRDSRKSAKRADIVLVTKSPSVIEKEQVNRLKSKINAYVQADLFFSEIAYANQVINNEKRLSLKDLEDYEVLLITGIANPWPLYSFLSEKNINFDSLKFGDHHRFSTSELQVIKHKFKALKATKKLILTTEKDFVRLQSHFESDLFYLPIQTRITENEKFNKKVLDYVRGQK